MVDIPKGESWPRGEETECEKLNKMDKGATRKRLSEEGNPTPASHDSTAPPTGNVVPMSAKVVGEAKQLIQAQAARHRRMFYAKLAMLDVYSRNISAAVQSNLEPVEGVHNSQPGFQIIVDGREFPIIHQTLDALVERGKEIEGANHPDPLSKVATEREAENEDAMERERTAREWEMDAWEEEKRDVGLVCADCGTSEGVTVQVNPYMQQVHEDETLGPLCDACAVKAADNV